MRHLVAIPLCLAFSFAAAASALAASPIAGDGLRVSTDNGDNWSPWQARLALAAPALPVLGNASPSTTNALLAGDRYFGWGRLGDGGGLRATGALLLGPGALGLAAPAGVIPRIRGKSPSATVSGCCPGQAKLIVHARLSSLA